MSEALNGACLAAAVIGGGPPVVAEHPGGPFSRRIRLTDGRVLALTEPSTKPARGRRWAVDRDVGRSIAR